MSEKVWLDVSIFRCPECGRYYADASWYAVELESDIECGICHKMFNAKKSLTDRVMLEFEINETGKALAAKIVGYVQE